jgi:superfamily II DNA or RNA helicase
VAQTTCLKSREWESRYSTSSDDLVRDFYNPALDRSVLYDRAVGYFRSSFYSVAGAATASFALRGGRIRMLCSPELTAEDADAIKRGLALRDVIGRSARRELDRILEHPLSTRAVETLAALVADGAMEIRFGVRDKGRGIFHDKVGVFTDADKDALSFCGSINETWQAWHPFGNHESFEVFRSWVSADEDRVADHVDYFQQLWDGKAEGVEVYEAPRAFQERLLTYAPQTGRALTQIDTPGVRPRPLLDHQALAIENWHAAGGRGILQHATGSGKTITALHAIRDWLAEGKPALVLVPSILLLEQWFAEAEREIGVLEPNILRAGGGHDGWRSGNLLEVFTEPGEAPRLTIQTASAPGFVDRIRGGDHLLIVADEVHRLGSPTAQAALQIPSGPRLGLSATPKRSGDPDGTAAILSYFGPIVEPVVTLADAIAAGRLCPYEYHVHLVSLSADETDEYQALTTKIGQAFGAAETPSGGSSYLQHLLIQRARLIKTAAAKTPAAAAIVVEGFLENQHWLVYCDNQAQVRDVLEILRAARIDAFEYHTGMTGDRDATMQRFRGFGGVLVAIRCLDEGVDLPEVTHAVIVASSQNTREFIQRRGRVLRAAPGKRLAIVHDLLVTPPTYTGERERSPFASLAEAELARAATFAQDAVNASTRVRLAGLCMEWNIDLERLLDEGEESDDAT